MHMIMNLKSMFSWLQIFLMDGQPNPKNQGDCKNAYIQSILMVKWYLDMAE